MKRFNSLEIDGGYKETFGGARCKVEKSLDAFSNRNFEGIMKKRG
jgi:hypothetical protein